jgi:hypothetical protein
VLKSQKSVLTSPTSRAIMISVEQGRHKMVSLQRGPKMSAKTTLAAVKNAVSTRAGALAALVVVYNGQTAAEKAVNVTVEDNGIGFSGTDAWLGSVAQQHLDGRTISEKQMVYVFKAAKKYAGQVIRAGMADVVLAASTENAWVESDSTQGATQVESVSTVEVDAYALAMNMVEHKRTHGRHDATMVAQAKAIAESNPALGDAMRQLMVDYAAMLDAKESTDATASVEVQKTSPAKRVKLYATMSAGAYDKYATTGAPSVAVGHI